PGILIVGTPRREAETERFRLADGRIAEYWRSSDVQDGTGSLPPLPLPPWLGAKQAGLARFAFPPGAALDDLVTPEPHLILAETGTLTVSLDGQAWFARMADGAWGLTAPAEQTLTFRPRDALLVPVGVHHTIRNGSTGGASMLGLLLYSAIDLTTKPWLSKTAPTKLEVIYSGSPISQREEWNGHASIELLARAFDIGAARGTPTLTITWLSLEPGQTLLPHPVGGVELLAAEAGSVLAGRARHDIDTGTDGQSSTEAEASVVTAGAAVAFPTGLSAPVVNGGTEPARLLLVAVEPPKPDTQASPTANLASRSGLARSQPSDAEDVVR
ncbi:MAG TPA: hypothetical protein VFU81_06355, partial [Thermomicrobiales bacterium]|nr:hypothetical protein [Thermomicrobiales bacterium]